jgi:erythromycin esterase-like protein
MDTLKRLMEFHGKQAKSIVWAHNIMVQMDTIIKKKVV